MTKNNLSKQSKYELRTRFYTKYRAFKKCGDITWTAVEATTFLYLFDYLNVLSIELIDLRVNKSIKISIRLE